MSETKPPGAVKAFSHLEETTPLHVSLPWVVLGVVFFPPMVYAQKSVSLAVLLLMKESGTLSSL